MKEVENHSWRNFLHLLFTSKLPWHLYIFGVIAAFASTTLSLGLPMVTQRIMSGEIFDEALIGKYVWLSIASLVLVSISALFVSVTAPVTKRNIQRSIWPKLIRRPLKEEKEGQQLHSISRVTQDPSYIDNGIGGFRTVLTSTYALIGSYAIMYSMNVKLTLALLPVIPYILIVTAIVGHFTQKTQYGVQSKLSNMTAFFAERLPKIRLIKTFGREQEEMERADAVIYQQYEADKKRAFVDLFAEPLMQSIQAIVVGTVLVYGGILAGRGEMKVSEVIAFYLYVQFIHNNVLQYGLFWQWLKQAKGASAKIASIKQSENEQLKRSSSFAAAAETTSGDITFENISFSYENKNVLSNLNFVIPAGKVTAIIGPSGGGKSTVLALLERLYRPNVGRILFGGVPAEEINLDDWRRAMVNVSQNATLLSGTIRDNITYGIDHHVTDEEVWHAAKLAAAKSFIEELPAGLDTEVGESGSKLSGGQRQRIAIARAFILDPKYLLLDEATSNLDPKSKREVDDALAELMKGRTTILVDHDLRNRREMDQIIVVDEGRISGIGTHEDLEKSNRLYHTLSDIQEEKAVNLSV